MLIVIVRSLSVVFALFKIARWPSTEKELSVLLAFRLCCFVLDVVLDVCVAPLPFGILCLAECGTRLYLFLIIAFSSTLDELQEHEVNKIQKCVALRAMNTFVRK